MISRSEKELKQVTHIVLPETENNTSDVNMEILIGIANGLFIVNQRCKYMFLIK